MRQGLPQLKDLSAKDSYGLYEDIEYKRFWEDARRKNLDELERLLAGELLPRAGRRIIDVGCGFGRLAECYAGRFEQIVLADGSISMLRQAVERTGGRGVYVACDAMRLPFRPATFDAVLMIRVFHHMQDPQASLAELSRISCGGASFIFSYVNKRNALRILRWLMRQNPDNPFNHTPDGIGSTMLSHHPAAIHELLKAAGFRQVQDFGAGIIERLGVSNARLALGKRLAPLLGAARLAPWMVCKSIRGEAPSLDPGLELADQFQCPACGAALHQTTDGYRCSSCVRQYPLVDGIFDFRIH